MNNLYWRDLALKITPLLQIVAQDVLQMRQRPMQVSYKADRSRVTNVDFVTDDHIRHVCETLEPHVPYVSEESFDQTASSHFQDYWLVDPIDGTDSLIRGSDQFCMCVTRIHNQQPVLGVIAIPATGHAFWGTPCTSEAFEVDTQGHHMPIKVSTHSRLPLRVVHSASDQPIHVAQVFSQPVHHITQNSAIKFVSVAQGEADHYVRTFGMHAWDCAAGDALVRAAGGVCTQLNGELITYASANQFIPNLIASGGGF